LIHATDNVTGFYASNEFDSVYNQEDVYCDFISNSLKNEQFCLFMY